MLREQASHPGEIERSYCVLLCSRNGARYIGEQLDSIAEQTVLPAAVLVFDDGSSDGTPDTVKEYQGSLPIEFVRLENERGGALGAFSALLAHAKETAPAFPYYFLCDQDDRWRPHKADRLLALLAGSAGTPAVAHSELLCFGDKGFAGKRFHAMHGHHRLESRAGSRLVSIGFENVVVGASSAFNRALLERALPVPKGAFMHDWWLAIACVGAHGEIRYTSEILTDYRVHAASVMGRAGRIGSAIARRASGLADGWRDPWLRTVMRQLCALDGVAPSASLDGLRPILDDGCVIARSGNFGERLAAWGRLLRFRVWSMAVKDAYYKGRLFTDFVMAAPVEHHD